MEEKLQLNPNGPFEKPAVRLKKWAMRAFFCCQGNGVLEMLLCTPLALLFLFVAVDGGISQLEKEALVDSLHTGVIDGSRFLQNQSLFSIDDSNGLALNREAVQTMVSGIARALDNKVVAAKRGYISNGVTVSKYKIVVSAILMPVNPESGEISGNFLNGEVITTAVEPSRGANFNLPEEVPTFPYVTEADFVNHELSANSNSLPSPFAIPLGVSYRADNPEAIKLTYSDQTIIIYAEITSLPTGLNPAFAKSVLGRFYGLQLQELLSVRTLTK